MKLKGLALTVDMGITLVLLMLLFAGGITWAGIGWIKDFRSDALRDECNQLEFAVRRYGQNHLTADVSSEYYDDDGKLHYNMVQTYPDSQDNLFETLHTLGYLVPDVKVSDFQISSAGAVFYRVNETRTKYRIEVTLPNGKTYVTPGSSSF